jgi:adenylate cyclase
MNHTLIRVIDRFVDYVTSPEPSDPFERAFARQILIGERLRMVILASLFGTGFIGFGVLSAIGFVGADPFLSRVMPVLTLMGSVGFVYELNEYLLVGRAARAQRQASSFIRYSNALIETSFPSLFIIGLATSNALPPVYVLLSPIQLAYAAFILLGTLRLDFWLCMFTGIVASSEYLALSWFYLSQPEAARIDPALTLITPYIIRGVFLLVLGVVAGLVSLQIKKQFVNALRTIEERNRIVNVFGQHVSPAVVEKLLAQEGGADSELKHVCLMFLDIRDFTTFSEKRTPTEVVNYLNSLFDFMIESINRHHGIINKFLGDGFMAVFGAPLSDGRDIHNAVLAAQDILAKIAELNAAGHIPPTRIGIGLHAGEAITGNVGSAARKEYTIIGDAVNLASRIEQLNKQFHSQLLVSDVVWQAIASHGYNAEALGAVSVKGHEQLVQVYKLA